MTVSRFRYFLAWVLLYPYPPEGDKTVIQLSLGILGLGYVSKLIGISLKLLSRARDAF